MNIVRRQVNIPIALYQFLGPKVLQFGAEVEFFWVRVLEYACVNITDVYRQKRRRSFGTGLFLLSRYFSVAYVA